MKAPVGDFARPAKPTGVFPVNDQAVAWHGQAPADHPPFSGTDSAPSTAPAADCPQFTLKDLPVLRRLVGCVLRRLLPDLTDHDLVIAGLLRYLDKHSLLRPDALVHQAGRIRSKAAALALDRLRARRREANRFVPLPPAFDLEAEERPDSRTTRGLVNDALARLPPRQREAFVLHYRDDLSVREIAELMGRNFETVKGWIRRARGRFSAVSRETQENPSGRAPESDTSDVNITGEAKTSPAHSSSAVTLDPDCYWLSEMRRRAQLIGTGSDAVWDYFSEIRKQMTDEEAAMAAQVATALLEQAQRDLRSAFARFSARCS